MVAGCGMKCIKFTMFFINFLFLLIGIALIAAGALVMVTIKDIAYYVPLVNMAPVLVIVIGSIVFVPAFCGCCGAIRESRCMLITYAVLMGILLLIQLVIAIAGFVSGAKLRTTAEVALQDFLNQYATDPSAVTMWNLAQGTFDCCGISSANDWKFKLGNVSELTNYSTPVSCCRKIANRTVYGLEVCNTTDILKLDQKVQAKTIFTEGCVSPIVDTLKYYIYIICAVILGVAAVELLGIIFAACLANAARSED